MFERIDRYQLQSSVIVHGGCVDSRTRSQCSVTGLLRRQRTQIPGAITRLLLPVLLVLVLGLS